MQYAYAQLTFETHDNIASFPSYSKRETQIYVHLYIYTICFGYLSPNFLLMVLEP